jgi:hypothetical protein
VGGCPLELPDEFADRDRGYDAHGNVDMRFRAADFVDERARPVDDLLLDALVSDRLDLGRQRGVAELGVPDHVQIDLAVAILGHANLLVRNLLKPDYGKPRERG